MSDLKWHPETRKLSELIPYENNPRDMTEKEYADLKKSIERFDYVEPIVINTDNLIIAGHQRRKVMLELGRGNEEVTVLVPSRTLTEQEYKEYLVRSNKNTGHFLFETLSKEFSRENLLDWGFSLSETEGMGETWQESQHGEIGEHDEQRDYFQIKILDVLPEDKDSIVEKINQALIGTEYRANAY